MYNRSWHLYRDSIRENWRYVGFSILPLFFPARCLLSEVGICMRMYVFRLGPLRKHHRDPAVASLPYRIVPSHQSAAQVWFDCISYLLLSPYVTFRGTHTLSPAYPFLLEASEASKPSN